TRTVGDGQKAACLHELPHAVGRFPLVAFDNEVQTESAPCGPQYGEAGPQLLRFEARRIELLVRERSKQSGAQERCEVPRHRSVIDVTRSVERCLALVAILAPPEPDR